MKRDVLIGFDLLLVLVVGLVLYAASARDPKAPPDLFDGLQLLLSLGKIALGISLIVRKFVVWKLSPTNASS